MKLKLEGYIVVDRLNQDKKNNLIFDIKEIWYFYLPTRFGGVHFSACRILSL
jgi:hypothetical protein